MKLFAQIFSGTDGNGSSRRATLLCALLVFFFIIIVNMYTGKCPDPDLVSILRDIIFGGLAAVFGEKVINAYADKMSNANKSPDITSKDIKV